MHLASLHVYPVKSLRGLSPSALEVDALGAVGDRRFMAVDPTGTFLTQRTHPRMARVGAFLEPSHLILRAEGLGEVRVARNPDRGAAVLPVIVWRSQGLQAEDCGDLAATWLSDAIGSPCRLVRIGHAFDRPILKPGAGVGDRVSFADAAPFLVTTLASLDQLNARLMEAGSEAVPMDRFRSNLVIAGSEAFAEDRWKRIRIGTVVFRSLGPCARCVVTTTDQLTGERGNQPLTALAAFRRDPIETSHVNFGQNLVNESKTGTLRVGDRVDILE